MKTSKGYTMQLNSRNPLIEMSIKQPARANSNWRLRTLLLALGLLFGVVGSLVIAPILHTVTFYENANSGDTVSTFQVSATSNSLTLLDQLPTKFSKNGYTFVGWNTNAAGSDISYSDGATYSFSTDVSLYAQWSELPNVHTVTFYENDSSNDAVSAFQAEDQVSNLVQITSLIPKFVNTGYSFASWNTAADGSGITIADGASYNFSTDVSLYAQWVPQIAIEIQFDLNGGVGVVAASTTIVGATINVPLGGGLTRTGFVLTGWNTESNGAGTTYALGSSFGVTQAETFYAQWSAVATDTVSLDANGASGSQAALSGDQGTKVTLPGQGDFIRPGFHLASWNTLRNGKGLSYSIGETLTLSSSLTLYAQWVGHAPPVLFNAIGSFQKDSSRLTPALARLVERVAVAIKSHHYRSVTLYGYSASSGLVSLDVTLSRSRAVIVARQLRSDLVHLHVPGVRVTAAGEGSLPGRTSPTFSRVEVFVA